MRDYGIRVLSAQSTNSLVFRGSMDWRPNQDSILYLVALLPLIRQQCPEVFLEVVGRSPSVSCGRSPNGKREYVSRARWKTYSRSSRDARFVLRPCASAEPRACRSKPAMSFC